jgi:DNA-binding CsgD family transcriptional regulator
VASGDRPGVAAEGSGADADVVVFDLLLLLAWFESDSKNLVAARFGLSVKTVETYIGRLRIKYAEVGRLATTKAALVARALQDGLVDLSEL